MKLNTNGGTDCATDRETAPNEAVARAAFACAALFGYSLQPPDASSESGQDWPAIADAMRFAETCWRTTPSS